jgi:predicted metalloprotease with PDZ domain
VLATELSVRTCHLDAEHGFLALAGVVLEVEGERWTPHRLRCCLPPDWQAFLPLPSAEPGTVLARDLDQLLDSPLEAGPHRELTFLVAGVPHRWVTWAGPAADSGWLLEHVPTLLSDVERVCLACCRLMGVERPAADHYLFVLHLLDEGYGGLEHDDGTVLVYSRRGLLKPDGYRKFLQLVAHEYLHQWNVRRLRPAELTPIDYHQPVPVPSLWFAEGVTSYVDQLLPLIAGLSTETELLQDLGHDLSRYLLTPGRRVQTLRDSSQEAWVKLYRADAYSADSQVSYYLKGAVLALCLDLHLRAAGSCLALVLQALWRSHGRFGRGYREQDLLKAFAVAAPDLERLLPNWLHAVDDPDLAGYLGTVGLSLQAMPATKAWTGLTAGTEAGQLVARRVQRGSPAEAAGVMVGDELLALDGERLREPEQYESAATAGSSQELLISRRSRLQRLQLQPLQPQPQSWTLVPDPDAAPAALARRRAWLSLVEPG